MPELMKLHDRFKDRGLVIIAVHDDSVESIDELEKKLIPLRKERWGGRDIPFRIALDGGGETRIRGTAGSASGVTTATYGIPSFPTTLLIDRAGKVRRAIRLDKPEDMAEIEAMLRSKTEPD